jgi:hypothetical protein
MDSTIDGRPAWRTHVATRDLAVAIAEEHTGARATRIETCCTSHKRD